MSTLNAFYEQLPDDLKCNTPEQLLSKNYQTVLDFWTFVDSKCSSMSQYEFITTIDYANKIINNSDLEDSAYRIMHMWPYTHKKN